MMRYHQIRTMIFASLLLAMLPWTAAFCPPTTVSSFRPTTTTALAPHHHPPTFIHLKKEYRKNSASKLSAAVPDLDVIGLVASQENYGLAVVSAAEALWSFSKAPSINNLPALIPGLLAAILLAAVSGPMITSGDVTSVGTGLWIATGVSVALGVSYVLRLVALYSASPKEIAALGLVVSIAGFFSFGQNLIVYGFVTLPSIDLPSLPLPQLELGLGDLVTPDVDGTDSLPPAAAETTVTPTLPPVDASIDVMVSPEDASM